MKKLWLALTVGTLAFWACSDASSSASATPEEEAVESSSEDAVESSSSSKVEAKSSSEKSKSSSSSKVEAKSSSDKSKTSSSSNIEAKSSSDKQSSSSVTTETSSSQSAPKSSSAKMEEKSSSSQEEVESSSSFYVPFEPPVTQSSSSAVPESSSEEKLEESSSSSAMLESSSSENVPEVKPDSLVDVNKYGYKLGTCGTDDALEIKEKVSAKFAPLPEIIDVVLAYPRGRILTDGQGRYQVWLPDASDYCEVEAEVKMGRNADTLSIAYVFGAGSVAAKCRCFKDHWFDIDAEFADVKFVRFENQLFEMMEK